ncbi:MAG: hypothetical protein QOH57_5423 [Mycobacterium sp.]|nr:hypothetical protein [Mycobacterium sp.]
MTAETSSLVRTNNGQTLRPAPGPKPTGILQPARTRRQHRPERNGLPENDFGTQSTGGQRSHRLLDASELRLHNQDGALICKQIRRRSAQRVEHKPTVVTRVPGLCRPMRYRNSPVGIRIRRNIRRVADDYVEGVAL